MLTRGMIAHMAVRKRRQPLPRFLPSHMGGSLTNTSISGSPTGLFRKVGGYAGVSESPVPFRPGATCESPGRPRQLNARFGELLGGKGTFSRFPFK